MLIEKKIEIGHELKNKLSVACEWSLETGQFRNYKFIFMLKGVMKLVIIAS
jgi:hypothetical protein